MSADKNIQLHGNAPSERLFSSTEMYHTHTNPSYSFTLDDIKLTLTS